jgi:hypothetical protein
MLKVYSKPREQELSELEKYIGSSNNPKFFFSMTQIDKLGINPQSKYSTPIGIYAYPLTAEYYKILINSNLPFAGDQPHIQLFTMNVPTYNLGGYTKIQLAADIKTLRKMYHPKPSHSRDVLKHFNYDDDLIQQGLEEARDKGSPISQFWNITRLISKTPTKWNALLRNLGYTNFYDPGLGIIYPSEPTQIVVLDPSVIIHFGKFSNKEDNIYKYKKLINNPDLHKHLTPNIFNNLTERSLYELWEYSIFANDYYTIANIIAKILVQKLDQNSLILQVMSANQNSSEEVLEILSNSPNIYVRKNVAMNIATPAETLRKLSEDPYTFIRMEVAKNLHTPKDILAKLNKDLGIIVRDAAQISYTPIKTACEIFELLTK